MDGEWWRQREGGIESIWGGRWAEREGEGESGAGKSKVVVMEEREENKRIRWSKKASE